MAKKQTPVATVETSQDEVVQEILETSQDEAQIETPQDEVQAPTMKVGQRAKQLILEGKLDNKGILEQIKKEYPNAKTSIACIAWYKSDLKKTKVDPDQGYKDWLKLMEKDLRAEYEATLVTK